jgi:hypothetical protein
VSAEQAAASPMPTTEKDGTTAIEQLMAREQRSLGRAITLLDSAELAEGVVVIVYESTTEAVGDLGMMHTVRAAISSPESGGAGLIVKTALSRAGESS